MFSDPKKNVEEFGFLPGQSVADLGSGAGHYAFRLSDVLGPTGAVYAIDVKKDSLVSIKNQAVKEGRTNLEVIWGDIEKLGGTKLRDSVVDGAVFSNILFQLKDKNTAIKEAKRILKPKGRLAVVEWSDLSYLSGVNHEGNSITVSQEDLVKMMEENGFKFEKSFPAGEHHYGLMFVS